MSELIRIEEQEGGSLVITNPEALHWVENIWEGERVNFSVTRRFLEELKAESDERERCEQQQAG